jgi:hypothetical protein
MNYDTRLFADIEERKKPLLSAPKHNFENLRDDEPLRKTDHFTSLGEENLPVGQEIYEGPPQAIDPKNFNSKELDGINGLINHSSKNGSTWQHKIFLRKHLNESIANSKELEFNNTELFDIAFGDNNLSLEIL